MFKQVRGSVNYACLNTGHFISVGAEGGGGYTAVLYGRYAIDSTK